MAIIVSTDIPFKASQSGDWQKFYNKFIQSLGSFFHMVCPHCHTKGKLYRCRTYKRCFYNCPADYACNSVLEIVVVKCHGAKCGHEHALFPSWICPYSHYSYPFIISILNFFFNEAGCNLSQTARKFSINRNEVRSLVQKAKEGKLQLLEISLVKKERLSLSALLEKLKEQADQLRAFLDEFIFHHAFPFLVRHTGLPGQKAKMAIGHSFLPRDKVDIP